MDRISNSADELSHYLHLLSDFTSTVSAAKSAFYLAKINSMRLQPWKLFSMFSSLLNPPSPPPLSSLTTDDFVTYFTKKVKDITSSFTPAAILPAPAYTPLSYEEVNLLVISNSLLWKTDLPPWSNPIFPFSKTFSGDILPFLTTLINTYLNSGLFPKEFWTILPWFSAYILKWHLWQCITFKFYLPSQTPQVWGTGQGVRQEGGGVYQRGRRVRQEDPVVEYKGGWGARQLGQGALQVRRGPGRLGRDAS